MPTLQDVARRANVPVEVAFEVLSEPQTVRMTEAHQQVIDAADALRYRLNITIRDVAALADVSTATVSNVLNNIGSTASQRTRDRVMDAIRVLRYRPNSVARNLQSSRTGLIGYGWSDQPPIPVHPVMNKFTYLMSQTAETHGYHILSFAERAHNPADIYLELYNTTRVDGFIISGTNRDDGRVRSLIDAKIPFVAFGRANSLWDFPCIDVDGAHGIQQVMHHLLDHGHTRIALIAWPEGSLSGDNRFSGYETALTEHGISQESSYIQRCENTIPDGYRAATALLGLDPAPTAIVCVTDILATGAIRAAREFGLTIGRDLAITGFDDDPASAWITPPLTTIRQPLDRIGQMVIEMLVGILDNRNPDQVLMLPPDLIIRESSTGIAAEPFPT